MITYFCGRFAGYSAAFGGCAIGGTDYQAVGGASAGTDLADIVQGREIFIAVTVTIVIDAVAGFGGLGVDIGIMIVAILGDMETILVDINEDTGGIIGIEKTICQPAAGEEGKIDEVNNTVVIFIADEVLEAVVITGIAAGRVLGVRSGGTIAVAVGLVGVNNVPAVVVSVGNAIAVIIR